MNGTVVRMVAVGVVAAWSGAARAVEIAEVFGPGMVLQRDVPVPVWGWASPGEEVTVSFGGRSVRAAADAAGRWEVTLGPLAAEAKGRVLSVKGSKSPRALTFDAVRVGEVWLVLTAGRTERQYQVEGPAADPLAGFRLFDGGRANYSSVPREGRGQNVPWGPNRRQRPAAVSIALANRLAEALGVPVGIVQVRVGGPGATAPPEGFAAEPALAEVARTVETWYPSTPRGREAYGRWLAAMKRWQADLDGKIARGEPITPTQPPPVPGPAEGDPTQPTVVYNRQVHPLAPLAVRGAVYVQGDSHVDDPPETTDPLYPAKVRALVAGLRAVFRRPGMPLAFTQRGTPSMYHRHTLAGEMNFDAWAAHRDRQRRVLPYDGVGMVVTFDVENYPPAVGERLARWALAAAYGRGGAACGPVFRRCRARGDGMVVEFDHAEGGLTAGEIPQLGGGIVERPAGAIRSFALAGADRVFRRAEARIEGSTVFVRSPKVPRPVAVRYAFQFDPRGVVLYNRAGLAAAPFRSDDWPLGDLEAEVARLGARLVEEIVARMGYPPELGSHAAARALAQKGERAALPVVKRLAGEADPDLRCGALRALGYLYWMGPVQKNYYGVAPQPVTPAIAAALEVIARGAGDADPLVRRAAAEALGLIGAENARSVELTRRLAADADPLVRTAALRLCKYRLHAHEHTTAVAYAVLRARPAGDRTSLALAGNVLNHARLTGQVDLGVVAEFLGGLRPGAGGPVVGGLGDMLRRIKTAEGAPALNDPRVLPAVLHLYALGYRDYMLYGVERWIALPGNIPAFRRRIAELGAEVERLKREKPPGWRDLAGRYADAAAGLEQLIEQCRKNQAKQKQRK